MNLHNIAGAAVSVINPWVTAAYQKSNGFTTSASGKQVPAYLPAVDKLVQKQALTYKDLMQISGLNINGEKSAMYISGDWQGVVRSTQQGGDILTLPDGTVWLVVQLLENWFNPDGWCKVAVTRQNP